MLSRPYVSQLMATRDKATRKRYGYTGARMVCTSRISAKRISNSIDRADTRADCVFARAVIVVDTGRVGFDGVAIFWDLAGDALTGVLTRAFTRLTGVRGISPRLLAALLLRSLPPSSSSSTSSSHSFVSTACLRVIGLAVGEATGGWLGSRRREEDELDMTGQSTL